MASKKRSRPEISTTEGDIRSFFGSFADAKVSTAQGRTEVATKPFDSKRRKRLRKLSDNCKIAETDDEPDKADVSRDIDSEDHSVRVLCAADLNLSGHSKGLSRKQERRLMKVRKNHSLDKGKTPSAKLELGGNKYKGADNVFHTEREETKGRVAASNVLKSSVVGARKVLKAKKHLSGDTTSGSDSTKGIDLLLDGSDHDLNTSRKGGGDAEKSAAQACKSRKRRSLSPRDTGSVQKLWSAEHAKVWKKQKELKEKQKKERELLSTRQSACDSAASEAASCARRILLGKSHRMWKEAVCAAAQELDEERVASSAAEKLRVELRKFSQMQIENEVAKIREMVGALPVLAVERRKLSSMAENRSAGDKAFAAQEYFSALRFWMQAMYDGSSTAAQKERGYWHVQLHCNRAAAHLKLQDARRAYDEATVALSIDETYAKARWRRAAALSLMGGRANLEEAKADLNIAIRLLSSDLSKNANRKLLQEIQTGLADIDEELKNPKPREPSSSNSGERARESSSGAQPSREGYLAVLQLAPNATADDVRKAFKRLALKWHPDKWSGKSLEEKEEASESFRKISDAKDRLLELMKNAGPATSDSNLSTSNPTPDPSNPSQRGRTPGSAGYFSNWSNQSGSGSRSGTAKRRVPRSCGSWEGTPSSAKSPFSSFGE